MSVADNIKSKMAEAKVRKRKKVVAVLPLTSVESICDKHELSYKWSGSEFKRRAIVEQWTQEIMEDVAYAVRRMIE
jgi:hypothetical protein